MLSVEGLRCSLASCRALPVREGPNPASPPSDEVHGPEISLPQLWCVAGYGRGTSAGHDNRGGAGSASAPPARDIRNRLPRQLPGVSLLLCSASPVTSPTRQTTGVVHEQQVVASVGMLGGGYGRGGADACPRRG